jgi:hypothetical protein
MKLFPTHRQSPEVQRYVVDSSRPAVRLNPGSSPKGRVRRRLQVSTRSTSTDAPLAEAAPDSARANCGSSPRIALFADRLGEDGGDTAGEAVIEAR